MSKRFHERLGIPDRKPFSQVDFKQNFLAPIIRDNKEKGDEFWVSYGKKGKLKDLITELEVAFKPILNGEHLTALAENKNEKGKSVGVEFFGPGDIFKILPFDLSIAITLQNLHSIRERLQFLRKNIHILTGDVNTGEILEKELPNTLGGNLITLGFFYPEGGSLGIPNGYSVWHLQHKFSLINNVYKKLSFQGGIFLSNFDLSEKESTLLGRWVQRVNENTGVSLTFTKDVGGYAYEGRSHWCLRIDKSAEAPLDLQTLF
jgi:hypothetical protein